jgi:hypothetical protein
MARRATRARSGRPRSRPRRSPAPFFMARAAFQNPSLDKAETYQLLAAFLKVELNRLGMESPTTKVADHLKEVVLNRVEPKVDSSTVRPASVGAPDFSFKWGDAEFIVSVKKRAVAYTTTLVRTLSARTEVELFSNVVGHEPFVKTEEVGNRDEQKLTSPPAVEAASATVYLPRAEVLEAWLQIEQLCGKLLAHAGERVPPNFRALGSRLKRYQLIDAAHEDVLDNLRNGRNLAAHGERVSADDARAYRNAAADMIGYLNTRLQAE